MNLAENFEPYYSSMEEYSVRNKEKAKFGEEAFAEALSDYPVLMNVNYGKRQKDIDHLVFTCSLVIMNECKNTKEAFYIWYSWFLSHIVNRFVDGYPIAQFYAHTLGYSIKNIVLTLNYTKTKC